MDRNLIKGEKGTLEHTIDNIDDNRVGLFFALVRDISKKRIISLIDSCINDSNSSNTDNVIADIIVMMFQSRDCRGGKGERKIFYSMLLYLYELYPLTILSLLPLVKEYGYYKDYFNIILQFLDNNSNTDNDLILAIIDIIVIQLQVDNSLVDASETAGPVQLTNIRKKVSMLAKYAPRESSSFAKNKNTKILFNLIISKLFPNDNKNKEQYRKMLTKINHFIDTTEVKMCNHQYSHINYDHVPSICLKKFCKAFLNEKLKVPPVRDEEERGNRYPSNEDRVLSRKHLRESIEQGKVQGKQLYPHEIVESLYSNDKKISALQKEMFNIQWKAIKNNLLEQLSAVVAENKDKVNVGKLVPLSDVSGSMGGIPMFVSIALGILISEVNHPAFRDRVVTFETNPQWVNLSDCGTIDKKVSKMRRAPSGGTTNIEKAFDLLCEVVRAHKLPISEVPDLIIFSDMQFDEAIGRNVEQMTQLERIKQRFHDLGLEVCGEPYPAPKIIFWNLRGNTVGFPAQGNSENVQMLSGFSPSLLKYVLEGGEAEEDGEEEMVVVDSQGNEVAASNKKKKVDPYTTLRKVLDDSRYYPVRRLLSESDEGRLREYRFFEPEITALPEPAHDTVVPPLAPP